MLRIADIRENRDRIEKGLKKKGLSNAADQIDTLFKLDDKRKTTQTELDAILNELKTISRQIGAFMKSGDKESAEVAKATTSKLKERSKLLQEELNTAEEQLVEALYNIPNSAHESVPEGRNSEDNKIIMEKGQVPKLYDDAKPHWELIDKYDSVGKNTQN